MTNAVSGHDSRQFQAGEVPQAFLDAARAAASWDVVHRPATPSGFQSRVHDAARKLKLLEPQLALLQTFSPGPDCPPHLHALHELRASARQLRSVIVTVSGKSRANEIDRLPRVVSAGILAEPRIAAAARLYLDAACSEFTASTFQVFIDALQAHEPFNVLELWNSSAFLGFVLLEQLLADAHSLLLSTTAEAAQRLLLRLKSLRAMGRTDWEQVVEPLIVIDTTLNRDPARTYSIMDSGSRVLYRERIAFVAHYSDCSERQVALTALELAQQCHPVPGEDPRMWNRRIHVGYYLIDKGFPLLAQRIGFHAPLIDRVRAFVRSYGEDFYITGIQILAILLAAAVIFPLLPRSYSLFALVLALLVVLLPATQDAVDLVNHAVTTLFDPTRLPRLDFSSGIPPDHSTLVVVPTLLLNEKQVHKLVTDLEVRYLANHDPNLHFALITDLPDSVSKPHVNDYHPLVALTIQLIEKLNAKYDPSGNGSFLLLHRYRVFNRRQGVWMGWERKRGKLLDLNRLLAGQFDAFAIKAGRTEILRNVRYVLTLDSDTQLPRGSAAQLVGVMAHPLHQPVVDPRLRIVTEGYGILQPRIGVTVHSANRSRLAAIYSGQTGFDIYTRAVSDAYQDLFGEGIFTGKGLYEVATLHAVLDHRFPRNVLLSHDLIEGTYARAGLVTDVELIDDYPSHYSAYSRRKHRWMRGDWQIAQWIFSRVPNESGGRAPNPISTVSRWKIFDNLRRSLVDPFLFLLFIAGWLVLPGGPLYWTSASLLLLIFPEVVKLGSGIGRTYVNGRSGGVADALRGFAQSAEVILLNLIFLPHQTILALDAIVRVSTRRFITGERLLEWETAAQAEVASARRATFDRYLMWMPIAAVLLASLIYFRAPNLNGILCAAPFLTLWACSGLITEWLNRPPREQRRSLASADETFLKVHALRIWRYFYQFGSESHNFLVPDNVQEEGLREAASVSPTNLGLLLNARQAACELGFLTLPEFVSLTRGSLASVSRMEKYRGHLYNWYDTHTLAALDASPFISTVDSGNFVASLYTLRAGALDLLRQPLLSRRIFEGLRTHWDLMRTETSLPAPLARIELPAPAAPVTDWIVWLYTASEAFSSLSAGPLIGNEWWIAETLRRVEAILAFLHDYMPWMLPEFAALRALPQSGFEDEAATLCIEDSAAFAEALEANLVRFPDASAGDFPAYAPAGQLRAALPAARQNLIALAANIRAIAQDAERFADETEFAFLAHPERHLLSIGYNKGERAPHDACYDALASEARIAAFLAVARGDLPQKSWFRLSREFARVRGCYVLLSWSGTMFEYLMPSLWMRTYPQTLLARAQTACVKVQRIFAGSLGIPWGISESGASRKNADGHYHYHAYGLPQIALSIEADAGPVVSPYSTFLALAVDPQEALRNLRRMDAAGWTGTFGFYEAVDFSGSLRQGELVREWMAHHQGMSLLAIVNLLCGSVVQKWFHSNPLVQSEEHVLHEMPPSNGTLRALVKNS
jgi:hypothetical protein